MYKRKARLWFDPLRSGWLCAATFSFSMIFITGFIAVKVDVISIHVKRLEEAITSTLIMPQGQGQARNETMLKMLSRDEQRNDLDVDDYSSDNDIHTDGVQQLNISDQAVSNKDFNNLLVNYAFKACLESSANDFIDCVQLNFEEPESRPQHTEYSNKRQKRDVKNEFGGINANHHPHKRNGVNFEVSLEAGQGRDRETVQSADSIVIDSSQPASQSEAAVRVVNAGPKYTPRGTADATGEEEIFGSENDPGARERERGLLRDLASDIDFAKDEQLTSQVSDTSPLIRRILRARLLDNDVSLMASMLPEMKASPVIAAAPSLLVSMTIKCFQ